MARYTKGFTHAGVFHADDVFCTALLGILFPDFKVTRGFKVPENFDGIVYDIGLGEFDHHQIDNEVRENGIPYAAFGKVYRHLIPELKEKFSLSDRAICSIEKNLVQPIDSQDNGVEKNLLSDIIREFNPCWNEDTIFYQDIKFGKAVDFATTVLNNSIRNQIAIDLAEEEVTAACERAENGIVILGGYAPWIDTVLKYPEIKFCIFPSARGGCNVQTVVDEDRVARCKFPEEWLGKTNDELGITFCHPGNWFLACDTLQHAIAVAELAIRLGTK